MPLPKNYSYSPLPGNVELKQSEIHGFGIFAKKDIEEASLLGHTHLYSEMTNLVRLPMGGYINHSDLPNCKFVWEFSKGEIDYYSLFSTSDIKVGEELTVNYNESPFLDHCLTNY